ncbi:MAG: hypothetical protein CL670_02865 [Balneola sp.]|jgi:asparagine synthase (glutamine-hydrolysing)|nr:hypothetical protein [Balneola sp.]MBE78076.1 hypothetical protein [Balneola sp.]|tara:strand:- start:30066 stop:31790 length:1725 start_codon:yes stop_codon:yes gene_type:complete
MAGIYGLLSKKKVFGDNLYQHFYSYKKPGIVSEEHADELFTYGRSALSKFSKDRFLEQVNDHLVIGFEGVTYSAKPEDFQKFFLREYQKNGISFIEDIKGQFCGFVYDKREKKLFIFTDHLSTKPLYFYINKEKEVAFFSSELKVISKSLRDAGLSITPDPDGFRCLLTCGYMLDNLTPVKEIKKLPYGTITSVSLDSFEVDEKKYFSIKKTERKADKSEFIKGINERMVVAVENEWNKDLQYSYEHFTLLSGGLDSRVNAMLGAQCTKGKIHSLTFSKPKTPDEKIAKQIAEDLGFNHNFIPMNSGDYLSGNEYDFVKANDGLVGYYGAAHQQYAIQQANLMGKGLIHSGQIGDVLFGSFTFKENDVEALLGKLFFSPDKQISSKIELLRKMKNDEFNGADAEVFSLEQRQINGTMNGDRACSHLGDSASPFYDKDLLSYCLSIPDMYKYKQAIYLDWMNECQTQLASFNWAATEAKPSNNPVHKTLAFKNRLKNYVARKIGFESKNMNPFEQWYLENQKLRDSIDGIYQKRDLGSLDKELKNDIEYTFEKKSVIPKMLAITAILSYRLHFLE